MSNMNPSASAIVGSARTFYNDSVGATVREIKATQGQIYLIWALNTVAAVTFLQVFFRPAASVVLGTTVADWVVPILTSGTVLIQCPVPMGTLALPVAPSLAVTPGTGLSIASTSSATNSTAAVSRVSVMFL